MDFYGKTESASRRFYCLKLKSYAGDYHATALKSVHFMNDWEKELSHTQYH